MPPITILKIKIEKVHEMCRMLKINDYFIATILIGYFYLKFQNEFNIFHIWPKLDQPYKAVLLGLDKNGFVLIESDNELMWYICRILLT